MAERRDSAGQVMEMLDRLPANQQETIRLKFQNGLSYREISAVTGLSVSHVGVLIHTGLKTLRGRLCRAPT
jgi:RNA polymerase sigma-70 factor (ECF subfamily)